MLISKRTNFDTISEAEIKHIEDCLNNIPKKHLNINYS